VYPVEEALHELLPQQVVLDDVEVVEPEALLEDAQRVELVRVLLGESLRHQFQQQLQNPEVLL
jgi:hypothetical protein